MDAITFKLGKLPFREKHRVLKLADTPLSYDVIAMISDWLSKPLSLERCNAPMLHKLIDARRDGNVCAVLREGDHYTGFGMVGEFESVDKWQVVCLSNVDWHAVIGDEHLSTSSFRPFAPHLCFEMRLGGRHCIVLFEGEEGGIYVECPGGFWLGFGGGLNLMFEEVGAPERPNALIGRVIKLIFGVAAALEMKIAERELHVAPLALNKSRVKNNRSPLPDFHIVDLSKRYRVGPSEFPASGDRRTSPRLHFRRGHYREYDAHKTWVDWTLVGDPDLGFIDKLYRG